MKLLEIFEKRKNIFQFAKYFFSMAMKKVILLLGGNLGDRAYYIDNARQMIEKKMGKILQSSSVYESAPWGFSSKNNFFNQVLVVNTSLTPNQILENIWQIEKKLGRERTEKAYSSRTIDIDILFYENEIIDKPGLIVPHKHLHERRFTLIPLAEILPGWIHPGFNQSVKKLLENCEDKSEVKILKD
ncbi:MAG: 2-amino-4-hydroxy-6-hydroxymethyldihydropteridine diphosphokinase [Thiohalospira sp.]